MVLAVYLLATGCRTAGPTAGRAFQREKDIRLLAATAEGSLADVQRSLADGANVNARTAYGATGLMYAAYGGHTDIATLLLSKRADVDARADASFSMALMGAQCVGDTDIAQVFRQEDTEVVEPLEPDVTALWIAAAQGHAGVVCLLADHGADVNSKGPLGMTALMVAALQDYPSVVRVLVEHRADVNTRDPADFGALYWALARGNTQTVVFLLENGADASSVWIGDANDANIIRPLLEKGAPVNKTDTHGRTALSYAAEQGNMGVAQVLLEYGADVNAKDNSGMTAIMYARENGRKEMVQILQNAGAKE